MPSIRQLAGLSGYSIATVSNALTGKGHMSPETRAKILELAEKYHYAPNRLSQGIWSGKTSMLGLVLPVISYPLHSEALQGVVAACFAHEYQVTILESYADPKLTEAALQTFIEMRVDGIILEAGISEPISQSMILSLRSHSIPVVSLDTRERDPQFDHVGGDEDEIAEVIVSYLMDLGHRDIAYIGPLSDSPGSRNIAIKRVLQRYKLPADYFLHVEANIHADQALLHWLRQVKRPTALIGYNDITGAEIINELQGARFRVPHDYSVIGCGNLPFFNYLTPALTTVDHQPSVYSQKAVSLLLSRIQEGQGDYKAFRYEAVPPLLVPRASCGKPRVNQAAPASRACN